MEPNLSGWYTSNIQGGQDAFTLPANGFGDFDRAVETKLAREMSTATVPEPSSLFGLLMAIYWGWQHTRR